MEGGAFVSVSSIHHSVVQYQVVAAPSVGGSLMYAWCKRHGSTTGNARASSAGVLVGPSGVGW